MSRRKRLALLVEEWRDCEKCKLHERRTQVVMYRGHRRARLMAIGEAPGRDEDEKGEPFVGEAGQTFDRLLVKCGLDPKHDIFIANVIGCRPPDNRKPHLDEMIACKPRLLSMVRIVKPKAILLLGATAAKLAGISHITRWRGKVVEVELPDATIIKAVGTYHPSYLNRCGGDPAVREDIIHDIKLALRISRGNA